MLTEAERRTLENWAKRRRTAQGLALRARIVLACAKAAAISRSRRGWASAASTVGKWRTRFLATGWTG